MKKKIIILSIVVVVVIIVAIFFFLIKNGQISVFTATAKETEDENAALVSVEDLEQNTFYIWHDESATSITTAIDGEVNNEVFKKCVSGTKNWDESTSSSVDKEVHTLWLSSENDEDIPTYYPGDELIYISSTDVPYDGINWERFADYGYTIGVTGLESDESGHYMIFSDDNNSFSNSFNADSDATQLSVFDEYSYLFLNKIGDVNLTKSLISDGGTVLGLDKNQHYLCEWYTGTYYQDFDMVADSRAFCTLETFTTYDYEFLHSNCISITIPEYFKSGYYYIAGTGLFRYLESKDANIYSGESYDENINWNDPIIETDENGTVIYDPFQDIDIRNEIEENEEEATDDDTDYDITTSDFSGDSGIESLEEFQEEYNKGEEE